MNINNVNTAFAATSQTGSMDLGTTMPATDRSKDSPSQAIPAPTQNVRNAWSSSNSIKQVVQAGKKTEELSENNAKKLAEELNDLMDDLQTSLGFSIREDYQNKIIVEIKNRETNELIKQIPAEQMLQMKEKIEEFVGLVFDQSV